MDKAVPPTEICCACRTQMVGLAMGQGTQSLDCGLCEKLERRPRGEHATGKPTAEGTVSKRARHLGTAGKKSTQVRVSETRLT